MLFSIIVASYNNVDLIKKTMDSILAQDYFDYEVIVVDGKSSDGSINIFNEYTRKFSSLTLISETDKGIYDAMNKGVKMAHGEYIFFLNLGDYFVAENVLTEVAKNINNNAIDIYYGDVIWGDKRTNYPPRLNSLFFLCERMICHQAIFAKREVLIMHPFNTQLQLCSDRNWLSNAIKNNVKYKKMDVIISNYDLRGASSNYIAYAKDSLTEIKMSYGKKGVVFVKMKRILGKLVRRSKRKKI